LKRRRTPDLQQGDLSRNDIAVLCGFNRSSKATTIALPGPSRANRVAKGVRFD
jgi:hypothetical protein